MKINIDNIDMENIMSCLAGLLAVFVVGTSLYGIIISFQSHVLTGVAVLVIEPLPCIVGTAEIFFDYPLADKITEFHQKIFDL